MTGIYKITSPSNNVYIGKSRDILKRFKKYKKVDCKSQIKLYHSLKKYGFDRHQFEIYLLLDKNISNENLDLLECMSIVASIQDGIINGSNNIFPLNLKAGGTGGRQSEEARKKMSNSAMGNQNGKGLKGSKRPPEVVEKVRIALTGKKLNLSDEQRKRRSDVKKGHKWSNEQHLKFSISRKGVSVGKGRKVSDESKENYRKASLIRERKKRIKNMLNKNPAVVKSLINYINTTESWNNPPTSNKTLPKVSKQNNYS